MDSTEKIIKEHLEKCGFTDITYEPNGNVPPDFVVNGKIAIEVRRLNQNFFGEGRVKGLEETAAPLLQRIEKLLESLASVNYEFSWFVFHQFSRPIPKWKDLKKEIEAICLSLKNSNHAPNTELRYKISENFYLYFYRSSNKSENQFLLGDSDLDSGGSVLAEIEKNLKYIITEKTSKIEKYKHQYSEWWLAVVDYIGYGISDCDLEMFKKHHSIQHNWDKILIVSPWHRSNYFELD